MYTVKKVPRLPDRIWDLFGWDNVTIWNTIHFIIDGRQSISWKDILDTIQLYPKKIWEGAGIQSNRNRNEPWRVIQIVPFYKPEWSTISSRKGTRKQTWTKIQIVPFHSIWASVSAIFISFQHITLTINYLTTEVCTYPLSAHYSRKQKYI